MQCASKMECCCMIPTHFVPSSHLHCLWNEEEDEYDKDTVEDGTDAVRPVPTEILSPLATSERLCRRHYLDNVSADTATSTNTNTQTQPPEC